MSHYAKVQNGIVIQVIVADEDFFKIFVDSSPGSWIQTSYNTHGGIHYGENKNPDGGVPLRANYAGIGYLYDEKNDVFYAPRPIDRNGVICDSWTILEPTWLWTPPIPYPKYNNPYYWDEPTKSWIEIIPPIAEA